MQGGHELKSPHKMKETTPYEKPPAECQIALAKSVYFDLGNTVLWLHQPHKTSDHLLRKWQWDHPYNLLALLQYLKMVSANLRYFLRQHLATYCETAHQL